MWENMCLHFHLTNVQPICKLNSACHAHRRRFQFFFIHNFLITTIQYNGQPWERPQSLTWTCKCNTWSWNWCNLRQCCHTHVLFCSHSCFFLSTVFYSLSPRAVHKSYCAYYKSGLVWFYLSNNLMKFGLQFRWMTNFIILLSTESVMKSFCVKCISSDHFKRHLNHFPLSLISVD